MLVIKIKAVVVKVLFKSWGFIATFSIPDRVLSSQALRGGVLRGQSGPGGRGPTWAVIH